MSIYAEGVPPEVRRIVENHPELPDYESYEMLTHTMFGLVHDAFDDPRYWNPEEDILELLRAMEEGTVEVKIVELPPPLEGRFGFEGTPIHYRYCAAAAAWLEAQHRAWTDTDLWNAGGRADIMTLDKKLAVEAGNTNINKVIDCLEGGVEVLMVPYMTNHLFGILLTPHLREKNVETLLPARLEALKKTATLNRTPFPPYGGQEDNPHQHPEWWRLTQEQRMMLWKLHEAKEPVLAKRRVQREALDALIAKGFACVCAWKEPPPKCVYAQVTSEGYAVAHYE